MAALDGCPNCPRWKSRSASLCRECDGSNARASYAQRTSTLATNMRVAALEELRCQAALNRMMEAMRG